MMVKLEFEPEILLDINTETKHASVSIQENNIAEIIFSTYHHENVENAVYFQHDGKETIKVNYDDLRVW